ncbi:ATP-binding protein [Peptacetobacter sp. AB845]|uniref:ATP-binding protein n=1 Tax=Peptacetobacter sp. AB845 TaxID=3388429 RepID=UPI0039C97220
MDINYILGLEEGSVFDRKSIKIKPKELAKHIIAFANSDGGMIAIGITDKNRIIEGIDYYEEKINDILEVPFRYCFPSIRVKSKRIECIDSDGFENHILLMEIESDSVVHKNHQDEVFIRVGDKSIKLNFEERIQLMYDKGERNFEDTEVVDAILDDIDIPFLKDYIKRIGYSKDEISYLKENKGFLKEKNGKEVLSTAAILLFGKRPQDFLPRARVRFIKYEGIEEKTGAEMNVIKDIVFEGKIYDMLNKTIEYIDSQIKEKTFLEKDGRFVMVEEYPKFVRQELVVNAVTHRDYSIRGTEIQIKMFDDRLVVESPGKLPGLVKKDNMRHTHFSRNPKIAEYLKYFGYVKEYGEGVDRIYKELDSAGFREVEYYMDTFILKAIVFNNKVDSSKLQYIIQSDDTLGNKVGITDERNRPMGNKIGITGVENRTLGNKVGITSEGNRTLGNKMELDSKIWIKTLEEILEKSSYKNTTKENIIKLYYEVETNQIIGNKEICDILKKSKSNTAEIIKKLKEIDVIVQVNGKGRGKYRFKYESEIKNKK